MNTKAASERYQRQVQEISKQPGNTQCADCGGRYPRWASWNLGIFLCVNCAGVHRKMGTHISKVKSLTLDTWTREQVDRMREIGNVKNNVKYNPDERRNRPPANVEEGERNSDLERFIFDKYRGKFMDARPPPVPSKDTAVPRLSPVQTGSSGSGSTSGLHGVRDSPAGRLRSTTTPVSSVPASWADAKRAVSPATPPKLPDQPRAPPAPSHANTLPASSLASSSLAPPLAHVPARSSSANFQHSASSAAMTRSNSALNGSSSGTAAAPAGPQSSSTSSIFDDLASLQQAHAPASASPMLQSPFQQQQAAFQNTAMLQPNQQMNPWAHLAMQQQAVVSPMVMSHATSNISPFFQPSLQEQQQQQQQLSHSTLGAMAFGSQMNNGAGMGMPMSASYTSQMMGQQAFGGGLQQQSPFPSSPLPYGHQQMSGSYLSPQQQPQQQSSGNPFGMFATTMMPVNQAQQPSSYFGGTQNAWG